MANLLQVCLHPLVIFFVDNLQQLLQLFPYPHHIIVGVGVEEDFLQQVVILVEHPLGDLHMSLEGGTRRILVLHHGCKYEGADKRDAQ